MSDASSEVLNQYEAELDPTVVEVTPVLPAQPLSNSERARARLNGAGNLLGNATARARQSALPQVQNAVSKASAKTGPLVDRAQAYRAHMIAAVAAVAVLLTVVLRRRAGGSTTDEQPIDLGDWHLTAEPAVTDE